MKQHTLTGFAVVFVCLCLTLLSRLTSFAAPGPPLRTGIWVMQRLPRDPGELSQLSTQLGGSRDLSGVCLHVFWNELEKEEGKPDYTMVDKTIALFHQLGMRYELGFGPGVHTPDFVYQKGAQAFTTKMSNPNRANYGQEIRFPIPWDNIYEREFSKRILQLGQRYANDPLCVGIVLTCANAVSAEMHLTRGRDELQKWHAFGDYGDKLLGVYKRYIDEWGAAFPHQAISLHLAEVLDLGPGFCEKVVDYGMAKYPERFTIQNCQLNGRGENTQMMTYGVILRYDDRVHHGFQSVAGFNTKGGERMGSIEMAALNVVHAQAEYWELWNGDGFNAETREAVARAWKEARDVGYEAYKKKLIAEGKYRS